MSCKVAMRWVVKLIENMDISLKSQCNRSSNRSFLSHCNVHKSEMDYPKNVEQGLSISFWMEVDLNARSSLNLR